MKTFKTRNRRPRRGPGGIPVGHVCMEQLKAVLAQGVEYFWKRRPDALRPDSAPLVFGKALRSA